MMNQAKWEILQKEILYELAINQKTVEDIEAVKLQLNELIRLFYQDKVTLQHLYNLNILNISQHLNPNKNTYLPGYELISDTKREFNNYYKLLEEFFMALRKDKRLLISAIKEVPSEKSDSLINFICNFCFEDPFNPLKSEEDLLEGVCLISEWH